MNDTTLQEMSFLKHLQHAVESYFFLVQLSRSATFSEIFSYTACRQVLQLFLAIMFFIVSEYLLAISLHRRSNVTLRGTLVDQQHWTYNACNGEVIRKMAIIIAAQDFTHLIKIYHEDHHKLVTSGVYSFVRHTGYCGFFIWSIGTQIMLGNPISTVAFAIVVWNLFARQIPYEEYFLRQFFGSEYDEYARWLPSGVPFVK
ncbi:hypothetical protein RHSIM_Rhsim02G0074800 [Rhododendron simsii]|uniref:Protein-S-isoprenylcysteine O-methyltransferase n=1 Tax=Rhododendron simsii TaxID=118357 RepID=A0A834HFL7_RHOSS|nr:hypothetical protein RHSIM_Rhsim02G0074800 [Rhododendron simsii]